MKERIIRCFGDHWERAKMFTVRGSKVEWTELAWPNKDPPLEGARGAYILSVAGGVL